MARYRSYHYYDFREPDAPIIPEWVQQAIGCVFLGAVLALLALIATL